jgi:hypothetical protein
MAPRKEGSGDFKSMSVVSPTTSSVSDDVDVSIEEEDRGSVTPNPRLNRFMPDLLHGILSPSGARKSEPQAGGAEDARGYYHFCINNIAN